MSHGLCQTLQEGQEQRHQVSVGHTSESCDNHAKSCDPKRVVGTLVLG